MMIAGCILSGCDNIVTHELGGRGLCCECYKKVILEMLEKAMETTHDYLNLGNEIDTIMEAME